VLPSALLYYATSRKAARSSPGLGELLHFTKSFRQHYRTRVDSASNRNLPVGKTRPARRADNIAAICEPNVG
jgi:hypothetical protein